MGYIAYLDLLGIKSVASFSNELYYYNIKKFQRWVDKCRSVLKGSDYKIRVFSDCAYIECDNLIRLFLYLQNLRNGLFLDEIFFNAAVTQGTLKCNVVRSKDQKMICSLFESEETVKVYSMQSVFSGVGIYVDPDIIRTINSQESQKYLIKSSFSVYKERDANNILYTDFESYYDIVYETISVDLVKFILLNFIKTVTLDKRAARYYLSAICTCIKQLSFEDLSERYLPIFLDSNAWSKNNIIFNDMVPIFFMIIDRLYESYISSHNENIDDVNSSIGDYLQKIIDGTPLRNGFDNLQFYSDKLINKRHKFYFSSFVSKSILTGLE